MLVALQMASRALVISTVNVECTIVRPSATGLWVASVRESRPLMSDEGNAGMGCTSRQDEAK